MYLLNQPAVPMVLMIPAGKQIINFGWEYHTAILALLYQPSVVKH